MNGKTARFFLTALAALTALSWASRVRAIEVSDEAFANAATHIQGICCDEEAVYLVSANAIFKVDWTGKLLCWKEAPWHSGDPTLHGGKLYVSMSSDEGIGLYEYDTDLNLLRKIDLAESHRTDGIAFLGDHLFIGGPSPKEEHSTARVVEYDADFNFVAEHEVDFGAKISYGTQTAVAWNDSIIFGFYRDDRAVKYNTLRVDRQMNVLDRYEQVVSTGIDLAPGSRQGDDPSRPRFLVCRSRGQKDNLTIDLRWYELRDGEFHEIPEPAAEPIEK
ncbi:MAG: hypothetical protein IIZ25_10620 [Thermoguttaceae bacterium]|nr:hypothetical protein [Thermoguttaceae bacterium]